ncbi:hypothetical protein FI667_g10530, partial [Globisporangium splendens]
MAITTRSKRVSVFGTNTRSTPASVGPGSYAPETTITSFKDVGKNRPLFSGFAASEERNLNANKTTSAITPDPGAYIDGKDHQSSVKAPSNVFATKASSFAPSAPGSTIFLPSSIQNNPGPGACTLRSSTSPPRLSSNNNQLHELDGRNNKSARSSARSRRKKHAVRGDASLGFSSATERYCLSKPSSAKVAALGLGAYKSEIPRSLNQPVKTKLSVGRHGVFGTTSERHVWEHLEKRVDVADVLTPAPGTYGKREATTML